VTSNTRDNTTALPLVEEEVAVARREVVTGRVRVRTVTNTKQEFVQEELHGEDLEVRCIPIDRYVEDGAAAPQIRT
jgi:stress response protein YsnF